MTTIKIIFRPSVAQGHMGSLCYRITHNSRHYTFSTGYSIYPEEWNEQHGLMRILARANASILRDL